MATNSEYSRAWEKASWAGAYKVMGIVFACLSVLLLFSGEHRSVYLTLNTLGFVMGFGFLLLERFKGIQDPGGALLKAAVIHLGSFLGAWLLLVISSMAEMHP